MADGDQSCADVTTTTTPSEIIPPETQSSRKNGATQWGRSLLTRRVRPSRLDCCDANSEISRSGFLGILNLLHIVGAGWIAANPIAKWYESGSWIDADLFDAAFKDTALLMLSWIGAFAWSYTAYGLFLLRQQGLSKTIVSFWMHLNQTVLVVGMMALCRWKGWAIFPSVFVLTVSFLHYMKMHSFLITTMDMELDETAIAHGFPQKCTLLNFSRFMLIPCLVYDLSYPRNPVRFRLGYFIRKSINLAGTMALIFLTSATFIFPVFMDAARYSVVHTLSKMLLPLIVLDFLFFYMMFECICNMLAEITDFGDREFYEDWWNCTTWDEFAREWNRPVHEFLLCHVYHKTYLATRKSKLIASVATFFFSALLHEGFLAATLGVVRCYMLLLMMFQIPLILFTRIQRNTTLGNYVFWFGISLGVPLLMAVYGHEWARIIGTQTAFPRFF